MLNLVHAVLVPHPRHEESNRHRDDHLHEVGEQCFEEKLHADELAVHEVRLEQLDQFWRAKLLLALQVWISQPYH